MKHFFKTIFSSVLIILVSSCSDFLEETPYSFTNREEVYQTDATAETALMGVYAQMSSYGGFGAGYPTLITVASGGFRTTQGPASDLNRLAFDGSQIWLAGDNSPWEAFYAAIRNANDVIINLPKGTASDAAKKRIIGEAKFLRGMLYFNLVRMFGAIPLSLEPPTVGSLYKARSPVDKVYEQIIKDLEEAKVEMLEPAQTLKGRPNKYAAYALLGKVYLTLAGNDPLSPYWQKAKDELLEVYRSKAYALQKSTEALFAPGNENTTESILEIQFSVNLSAPNGQYTNFFTPGGSTFTPNSGSTRPFGRILLNKEIFEAHRTQYPTDPRINSSYIFSSYTKQDGTIQKIYPDNKAGQGWPYIKKYVDPSFAENRSNRNFIYLRYADVLLMLAEAENEINGPANAYAYVNELMYRARTKADNTQATTPANWSGMTKEVFRDRIMLERRYELIGEGHLWYDVRRRGVDYFLNFLKQHNESRFLVFSTNPNQTWDVLYDLNPRLMLFPIPNTEVNANPLIGPANQNPGY